MNGFVYAVCVHVHVDYAQGTRCVHTYVCAAGNAGAYL